MSKKSKGKKSKLPGTEIGENVFAEKDGNILTLRIDLSHRGQASEKGNIRVCSTLGNKRVDDDEDLFIGVNAYLKP